MPTTILTKDTQIVEKNLEKMLGHKEGEMQYQLLQESIGGNAGAWQGSPCAGANFYFNSETGEIGYFGNIQDVPEEIRREMHAAIFCVAADLKADLHKNVFYKIVGTRYRDSEPTERAKINIQNSVDECNRRKWKK